MLADVAAAVEQQLVPTGSVLIGKLLGHYSVYLLYWYKSTSALVVQEYKCKLSTGSVLIGKLLGHSDVC